MVVRYAAFCDPKITATMCLVENVTVTDKCEEDKVSGSLCEHYGVLCCFALGLHKRVYELTKQDGTPCISCAYWLSPKTQLSHLPISVPALSRKYLSSLHPP